MARARQRFHSFGPRIRQARIQAGFGTLEAGAAAIGHGKTKCMLSDWEVGRTAPNADSLVLIAITYGISLNWLLGVPLLPAFDPRRLDFAARDQSGAAWTG